MEAHKMENVLRIALVILTAGAAAMGVQLSPAARPDDITEALRFELAPLKSQVAELAAVQAVQGVRLAHVEAHLPATMTPVAAP